MGLNSIDFNRIDKDHKLRVAAMYSLRFLPDVPYLKLMYRLRTGKKLNLENPKGFNEKLNWLKLNDKHVEYGRLVDKLAVREIVEDKLGPEYLFPLLGSWARYEDIDWENLPEKFVLKCSHDSGSTRIIKSKTSLSASDYADLKTHFTKRINQSPFFSGREYPYKYAKPMILAEQFMEADRDEEIKDYKFLCFDGVPKLLFIVSDRHDLQKHREDYYDMEGNYIPITWGYKLSDSPAELPVNFEEMKQISAKLSEGIKHVRIDLYEIKGKVYFGEYTFFTGGGFLCLDDDAWERKLGDWIKL